MPTLYSYATDEVDGTIFDNIQRRISHIENASAFRMSEYPVEDITDGKADKFIEVLIEDLATLTTSISQYTEMLKIDRSLLTYETAKMDNITALKANVKLNIKNVYLIQKEIEKYERKLRALRDYMPYISLTNFLDFRTAYDTFTTQLTDLLNVGTDLLEFLIEDGLIKTKGFEEVNINRPRTGLNYDESTPYYRRKITEKMLLKKMEEISKRPDYVWNISEQIDPTTGLPEYEGLSEEDYNAMIGERNRVELLNQALDELNERDYVPNQKVFPDKDYELWYDKLTQIIKDRKLANKLKKGIKISKKDAGTDPTDEDLDGNEGYVPYEEPDVSFDEEGDVVRELPQGEDYIPYRPTPRRPKPTTEEEEMEEVLIEEKEQLETIKLISSILKRINEPFKKLWEKLLSTILSIDGDMELILNNFNEYRQQRLEDPTKANEENEALLNNPYGMKGSGIFGYKITSQGFKKKGGNFTKRGGGYWEEMAKGTYKDGKYTPHYDTGISLKGGAEMAKYDDTRMGVFDDTRMGVNDNIYNAYSGGIPNQLAHPSRREMARYYGSGGSKFI